MSVIKPFCGLRPKADLASRVASLPYDVMDSEEARQLTATNPYSFLRVTKSEVDLPREVSEHDPKVYDKARENLEKFITDHILLQDDKPSFYVYKQQMGSHVQIGLVGAASVEEYAQNIIKKHELTRPDKEQDRIDHIMTTKAQTGAVFLTYKSQQSVDNLLLACTKAQPVYDFTAEDSIVHTLYVVNQQDMIERLQAAFAKVDILYIADGHHRSAAAEKVRNIKKAQNSNHTGEEEYNFFLAVIFPHHMMQIMDYNRVVKDLNGLTPAQLLTKLQSDFLVEKRDGVYKPKAAHTFGMYLEKSWYKLTAKDSTFAGSNPVDNLDVSILQEYLLSPVLGIGNPRTDKRIHFVGGIRGMQELVRLVDEKAYEVAFSLYPTSIEELMDIADAGEIMPPKSTWFEPKLRDAMVVHLI